MARHLMLLALGLGLGPGAIVAQAGDYQLHAAALSGDTAGVRELLEAGVFAEEQEGNGRTALFFAAAGNHVAVLEQLLRYGVRLETVDGKRWTPLMIAAFQGSLEAVRFLLEWGADPEANADGRTARDLAEEQGHQAVARVLADATSPFRAMAAREVVPGRVYVEAEADLRPQRTTRPRLRYPAELRRDGIEGSCVITYVVSPDGEVIPESYRTLACTHPGFRLPARDAALGSGYEPGRIEDTPVPVRIETRLSFAIQR